MTKVSRIGWTTVSFAFMISVYIFVATHVSRRGGGKLRFPLIEECLAFYYKLTHKLSIKILIKINQKVNLKNGLSSIGK